MPRWFRVVLVTLAGVTVSVIALAALGTIEAYRYDRRAGGDDLGYFWATIIWALAALSGAFTAAVWWWGRRRWRARGGDADGASTPEVPPIQGSLR